MRIEAAPLPYAMDALAPHLSAKTVTMHYESHHTGLLEKLQTIVRGRPEATRSMEDLIRTADGELFGVVAQLWNQNFYWRGMRPGGGGRPPRALLEILEKAFGSLEDFEQRFADAANGGPESGFAWLVWDRHGQLLVQRGGEQDTPLRHGSVPLLALDVGAHAYDGGSPRGRSSYVRGFLHHLVSWRFVAANLALAARC